MSDDDAEGEASPATLGDLMDVLRRLLPSGTEAERERSDLVQTIAVCMVLDVLQGPTARLDKWLADVRKLQKESALGGTDGLHWRAVELLLAASRGERGVPVGHTVFGSSPPEAVEREVKRIRSDGRGVYQAVARLALKGGWLKREKSESEQAAIDRIANLVRSAHKRHEERQRRT